MSARKWFKVMCTYPNCKRYDCKKHRHINKNVMPPKLGKCGDCGKPVYKGTLRCVKCHLKNIGRQRTIKSDNKLNQYLNLKITEKVRNI